MTFSTGLKLGMGAALLLFAAFAFYQSARAQTPACSTEAKGNCIRVIIDTEPETPNVEFSLSFLDVDDVMPGHNPATVFELEDEGAQNRRDLMDLPAGSYRITLALPQGWQLHPFADDAILCEVGAGGVADVAVNENKARATVDLTSGRVVCTFTVSRIPATPTPVPTATSTPLPPTPTPAVVASLPFYCDSLGRVVDLLQGGQCPPSTPTPAPASPQGSITPPNTGDGGLR